LCFFVVFIHSDLEKHFTDFERDSWLPVLQVSRVSSLLWVRVYSKGYANMLRSALNFAKKTDGVASSAAPLELNYCGWRRDKIKFDVAMDATNRSNPHFRNPPYQTKCAVPKNAGNGTTDSSAFNVRHSTAITRHVTPNQYVQWRMCFSMRASFSGQDFGAKPKGPLDDLRRRLYYAAARGCNDLSEVADLWWL
jgi:hypothetical protein